MFKIGNVEIKNKVVIAPMAGVSDIAFRRIIKRYGAGLIYAEMVSDKALVYENVKTHKMLETCVFEKPMVMQVFGSDVESMVKAAQIIDRECDCEIIDINMGCPVNKVVKTGAGSALMQKPELVYEIVSEVVKAVKKPVTVKIRLGWDQSSINAVEIAKLIEKAGASAIAVHGRTRSQFYEGLANWSEIKKVKDAVNIPVIGNGDVRSGIDAKRMIEETGVDAVMIGRATMGNPFIAREIAAYLEDGTLVESPSLHERITVCLEHARALVELKGEHIGIREMRSHAAWYLKGVQNSTAYKKSIMTQVETYEQLEELLLGMLYCDK